MSIQGQLVSLTKLLVPTYIQMLQALSAWLEKAQTEMQDAEALLSARLAPDMYPLSSQVRFACLQAREAALRLRGEPLSDALDDLAREGRSAGEQPGSMADAQARITETLSLLGDVGPDALDASTQSPLALELPDGLAFDMNGEQYARDWAMPQFYFHLVTAYAILRARGVKLGKADYVKHMFSYLRT